MASAHSGGGGISFPHIEATKILSIDHRSPLIYILSISAISLPPPNWSPTQFRRHRTTMIVVRYFLFFSLLYDIQRTCTSTSVRRTLYCVVYSHEYNRLKFQEKALFEYDYLNLGVCLRQRCACKPMTLGPVGAHCGSFQSSFGPFEDLTN